MMIRRMIEIRISRARKAKRSQCKNRWVHVPYTIYHIHVSPYALSLLSRVRPLDCIDCITYKPLSPSLESHACTRTEHLDLETLITGAGKKSRSSRHLGRPTSLHSINAASTACILMHCIRHSLTQHEHEHEHGIF